MVQWFNRGVIRQTTASSQVGPLQSVLELGIEFFFHCEITTSCAGHESWFAATTGCSRGQRENKSYYLERNETRSA